MLRSTTLVSGAVLVVCPALAAPGSDGAVANALDDADGCVSFECVTVASATFGFVAVLRRTTAVNASKPFAIGDDARAEPARAGDHSAGAPCRDTATVATIGIAESAKAGERRITSSAWTTEARGGRRRWRGVR